MESGAASWSIYGSVPDNNGWLNGVISAPAIDLRVCPVKCREGRMFLSQDRASDHGTEDRINLFGFSGKQLGYCLFSPPDVIMG